MKDKLKVFIEQELLSEKKDVLYDDNLLVSGLVDSLGFIKIIQFLEKTYEVTIPPKDMLIENFMNINAIEKYMHAFLN